MDEELLDFSLLESLHMLDGTEGSIFLLALENPKYRLCIPL